MEEPSIEYDAGFIDGVEEGKRQGQERIKELEEIYLGQIRVIARSRITYKERVERMATLAEQALKGGD